MSAKHLWEIDHSYYCSTSNYYAKGNEQPVAYYESWNDFIEEQGDADLDMNMVFRFDWIEGEDHDLQAYNGDDNYRHAKMLIFFMGQRKGLFRWSEVEVCRNDEPAILAYLRPRWDYMRDLWAPISVEVQSS